LGLRHHLVPRSEGVLHQNAGSAAGASAVSRL